MLDVVEKVAAQVYIPFSVGGGIRSVEDANSFYERELRKLMSTRPLCNDQN